MKQKKWFKRVGAVIVACAVMLINVVIPSYAMAAVVAEPVILLVAYMLVSAGVISQSQCDSMTDTQIMNEFYLWSTNPIGGLGMFLAEEFPIDDSLRALLSDAIGVAGYTGLLDWLQDYTDTLEHETSSGVDFGYGCYCKTVDIYDNTVDIFYGDYGIIRPNSISYTATVCPSDDKDIYEQYFGRGSSAAREYTFSVAKQAYNGSDRYIVTLGGSWYYEDGTPYTGDNLVLGDELPVEVGTVTIDGVDYPINDDGTVTIDGTTYTLNPDGSVTIGGSTYYPDYDLLPYDDTALRELIRKLIEQLSQTTTLEDVYDDSNPSEDVIDDSKSVVISDADFGSLTLDKSIATVFPFCLPFDFYNGLKLLSASPVAPKFEIPFNVPAYKSFPGVEKTIVVDFSEYEKYFYVVRWGMFTIAMFGMIFVTFKIVKGAR